MMLVKIVDSIDETVIGFIGYEMALAIDQADLLQQYFDGQYGRSVYFYIEDIYCQDFHEVIRIMNLKAFL